VSIVISSSQSIELLIRNESDVQANNQQILQPGGEDKNSLPNMSFTLSTFYNTDWISPSCARQKTNNKNTHMTKDGRTEGEQTDGRRMDGRRSNKID
jgi:hypothetical protein